MSPQSSPSPIVAIFIAAFGLGIFTPACKKSDPTPATTSAPPTQVAPDAELEAGGHPPGRDVDVDVDVSTIDPAAALLDEAKQKAIWDAEHYAHLLEWRFGPKFRKAFESADRDQLIPYFREGFKGAVLPLPEEPQRAGSLVRRWQANADDSEKANVDATGLIDWMVTMRQKAGELKGAQFRVLRIDKTATESEWILQVLLAARGKNAAGELVSFESMHRVSAVWSDEDDIDGGSIFQSWSPESISLTSAPRPLLQDVTTPTGLSDLPIIDNWELRSSEVTQKMRFQYAVDDYDLDGYLDIAVATLDRRLMLLRSVEGKAFVEVTEDVGLPPGHYDLHTNYSATWIDYNNDGYPDLVLGAQLFKNVDGEKFVDVTEALGLAFEGVPMGYAIADYDLDGLLDLYCVYSNATSKSPRTRPPGWIGDDASGGQNVLWRNTGDAGFVRASKEVGATNGRAHTLAAAWFFADQDHLPDLYIANDFGRNVLLRNKGDGTFEDISKASGSAGYATSMGVVTGDLDNDERSEIYVANMFSKAGRRVITQVNAADYPRGVYTQIKGACAGNRLYRATGASMSYSEGAEPLGVDKVGWAYGPAMVDYDNDGHLDLYSTAGFLSFDRRKPDG